MATLQEELTEALRDYLYDMLRYAPPPPRRWVMSRDWWKEVMLIEEYHAPMYRVWSPRDWAFTDQVMVTLLGIRVEVRDGAGVPDIEPGEPS